MGAYLSTSITSPQTIAAGGLLSGGFTATSPSAGHFYAVVEQFTSTLVPIPGSRAYLHQPVLGGAYLNSTVHYTVVTAVAAGESGLGTVNLTVPNTDCYLYVFLKKIGTIIPAGSFVVGNTYKILSLGTTDFTLVGAASNTVGVEFVATGVGAGTGTVCTIPDPDVDETIDYVVIQLQSSAISPSGLDISSLMSLMITMMIVMMMMKMMSGMMTGL